MIYLILSSGFVKSEEGMKYFPLLKIGYTEDSNKDRRFLQYKMHNPTCQILFEIPSATEDHEKRVQYKFRDLLFSDYGREWFSYSEEIIEFFKGIKSLSDIEKLPKNPNKINEDFYILKNKCKRILESMFSIRLHLGEDISDNYKNEIRKLSNEIATNLDNMSSEEDILEVIKNLFGEKVVNEYLNLQKIISESKELCKFIEEFYNTSKVQDKLKLIVESNLDQESLDYIFKQIDPFFERYYKVLGPEKLRGWRYDLTDIAREYNKLMFDKDILREYVYQEFKEGDKISLANLKNRLSLIYSDINYFATPKASDLEQYFELKACKFVETQENGEKKSVNGYKLIKKKY